MSLSKLTVIVLLSVAALACQKDEQPAAPGAGQPAAKSVEQPAATAATVAQAPAAAAAAPSHEAQAPGHECSGDQQKMAGCAGMKEEAGGGCNQWDEAAAEVTRRGVPQDAVWTSYEVSGMTCGGCERRIQAKVGEIEGVVAVEASAELGKVRVAVRPDAKDSHELARTRIAELGYKVQ